MKYTVKSLAKISNVSVRMLHFYDEIGLLNPASRGENGYRYYGEEQLLMLQQILFYRELGISLGEIQKILQDSSFNKITALKNHKSILLNKIDHEKRLIQTIDETINYLTGETKMEHEELYQGFDVKNQKAFEEYMITSGKISKYEIDEQREKLKGFEEKLIQNGEIENGEYIFERYMIQKGIVTLEEIQNSRERVKTISKEDNEALKEKAKSMQDEFVELVIKNEDPSSEVTQELLDRNYELSNSISPLTKEKFVEVVTFYLSVPEMRKIWDDLHPKLADFVDLASKSYGARYSILI